MFALCLKRACILFGLYVANVCTTSVISGLVYVWIVFGLRLDHRWTMYGTCLEHVSGIFGYVGGILGTCLQHVWRTCCICFNHVLIMFGGCLKDLWTMFGVRFAENIRTATMAGILGAQLSRMHGGFGGLWARGDIAASSESPHRLTASCNDRWLSPWFVLKRPR